MEKSQKSQISEKKDQVKKIRSLSGKKKIMFEALQDQLGVITAAAKQTGIDRRTHYRWIEKDKNYEYWVKQIPDLCLDFVENALFKNIKEGKTAEIIFYLKTKGKKRGYIEQSQIDLVGDKGAGIFHLITKSTEEIKDAKNKDRGEEVNNKSEAGRNLKST